MYHYKSNFLETPIDLIDRNHPLCASFVLKVSFMKLFRYTEKYR